MSLRDSIIIKNIKYIPPRLKKLRKVLGYIVVSAATAILLFLIAYYYYLSSTLPPLTTLTNYRPDIVTKAYSDDGILIGEFFLKRREVVPLSMIPERLVQAFVSAEDGRFFEHEGLDFISILRALFKNIMVGEVVQGGSTITQQVAKSILSSERTLRRKTREAILTYRIEKELSKDEIVHLYLNEIYLGHGAYGVKAAAHNYFRKELEELNLAEMAVLAGLPQAPSRYSPAVNPEMATEREFYVLYRMVEDGYINIVEATDAMNIALKVYPVDDVNSREAPYFTEHIRRYLEKTYGSGMLYREGLTVQTTLKLGMQKSAQRALAKGLADLDRRQGFRKVEGQGEWAGQMEWKNEGEWIDYFTRMTDAEPGRPAFEAGTIYKGMVTGFGGPKKETLITVGGLGSGIIPLSDIWWARKPDPETDFFSAPHVKDPSEIFFEGEIISVRFEGLRKGDREPLFSLYQEPEVQGAILAMEPESGFVRAMVGGLDFKKSKFNRAVQSLRQPGSAFKPILYAAALDKGYSPVSILTDKPFVYRDNSNGYLWEPKNYDGRFLGPVTLRTALVQSRNIPAIMTAKDIGIDYLISYARRMGISSWLARDLSLSLGSSAISLAELTSAYAIFPAGGLNKGPVVIRSVVDRDGRVLEENNSAPLRETYDNKSREVVIKSATGEKKETSLPEELTALPEWQAISPQTAYIMTCLMRGVVRDGTGKRAKALGRPVGGKTGTTDDNRDAWFVGFTPSLVAGVWVGFDDRKPLGKKETGSRAAAPIFVDFMKDVLRDMPPEEFPVPGGIEFARVDVRTGRAVPSYRKEGAVEECFREGSAPRRGGR
ncbi:MAG: PBP1A family penicillin-binding protein [bacterium]|nr:PBP1A family penicillin-binding protein [bacterium]